MTLSRRTLLPLGLAAGAILAAPRMARAAPPVIRYATGGGIGPK